MSELLKALWGRRRAHPRAEADFQKLVSKGLDFTTVHLSRDYQQLRSFSRDWEGGKFFVTGRGAEKVVSRTSILWSEAYRYLEVSSELKRAKLTGGREGLANETSTSAIAESTLDLATRVLAEFKGIRREFD